jgi:endogenous inhibitor of DNA gyrase (YacG/DUF329 family)
MDKICVQCNNIFTVEIKEGSGGTASLRRKYCSDSCKRLWKTKNGSNNYITVKCEICTKEISKFPSLVKQKNYCSKECQNLGINGIQQKGKKSCLICGKEFEIIVTSKAGLKRKYCSYECSRKVIKNKTGSLLECENCKKEYYAKKYQSKKRKYCSNPCQFEAQSKGIKHIPTNGRTGYRKDLPKDQYFKSAFEADYARYLIKINTVYQYEKHTFRLLICNKHKHYTPDFFLPDTNEFIELKGAKGKEKYNKNLECVEELRKQNINIKIIYMNDFYHYLRDIGMYDKMFLEAKNYSKSKNIIEEKNEN